ncbi:hypothetical protein BJY24_001673 [Nocardia transvalensis]|uniref:Lipoprotein n=1 Tax=Nocardia transvalensis TaxID=37333 RepID=A0A7W9PB17_9NOCA|nr:hypothetical protein [Nocardia transvalensis]MBB5912806.1 hypothetical protein [Nocardia transvalensis]
MHSLIKSLTALCVATAIASTAACGSDSPDTSGTDPSVDLTKLDTGPYATTPRRIDNAQNMVVARYMEAERLGNIMPLPTEVDPALKYGDPSGTHAFLGAGKETHSSQMFRWLRSDNFDEAAQNYVAGYSTIGLSNKILNLSYELVNSVLIFSDEDSARAAAGKLSEAGYYMDGQVDPGRLEKYPDAIVRQQAKDQTLFSWLATGKYVIVTIVQHHENKQLDVSDFPFMSALAEKTVAATIPALEKFVPTPPDKLMTVPIDPENMRGRTVRRPEGDSFTNVPGTYTVHGALDFADDIEEARRLYEEAGVDLVTFDGADLYRTKGPAAAAKLFEATTQPDRFSRHAPSPAGLPNALCFEFKGPKGRGLVRYNCQIHYDRFAAQASSSQLQDAQQKISAQYAILANSK